MRKYRDRRKKRKERKYSKREYQEKAVVIQKFFREYLTHRYDNSCSNSRDDDCIMLEPVKMIPRDVMVVVDKLAFDSRHLLTWMTKSNSHPLSRQPLPDSLKESCICNAVLFLQRESNINSNRKGFFSRKRILKRTLDRHRRNLMINI